MRAVSYDSPYRVSVRDKPTPDLQHSEDALLRVTRAAICGSDLHLFHGLVPDTRAGCTFGHEFTGVVEEVGKDVRQLKRGDRVVVPFNIACGRCWFCQRGLYATCERANPMSSMVGGVYGYSHTTGGYDGGQAEYVRVPFSDVGPMRIPDDMDDEEVLLLSDVLPTGYQAAEMGDVHEGDTVVVLGAGPVGQVAARVSFLLGADRVIVVDRLDDRLDFAQRYSGAETVNYLDAGDPVLHLRELTQGRGPDVVIEAVGCEASGSAVHGILGKKLKLEAGSPVALHWAIHSVRKGGRVSIIGLYGPPFNLVPIGAAMNKGLTLRMGQCNVKRYLPKLLAHVRGGRLDGRGLITHRFPLERAVDAYDTFDHKRDGCVKCVLIPAARA